MSAATRRALVRKFASACYRWSPRLLKKVMVGTSYGVAVLAQSYPRMPLPATAAHHIMHIQHVLPSCKACYHPVLLGETHGGYCAEQRDIKTCTGRTYWPAGLISAANPLTCAGRNCQHVPNKFSKLCVCCADNVVPTEPGIFRSYLQMLRMELMDAIFTGHRV